MAIEVTQGETFEVRHTLSAKLWNVVTGDFVDETDFTGWTLVSRLQTDPGRVPITDLVVTLEDPVGAIALTAPVGTAGWPAGNAKYDVRLTSPGGLVAYTPTIDVKIIMSVTGVA